MRYPGKARDEAQWRLGMFSLALFLFVCGTFAAKAKIQAQNITVIATSSVTVAPSPTPTNLAVRLRLYDQKTDAPIKSQEVTFVPSSECETTKLHCEADSPVRVTTNEQGEVVISADLIYKKPKVYAPGYKMDRYFSALNPEKPNELSLYYVTNSVKVTYDIEKELLPVALIPVEQ